MKIVLPEYNNQIIKEAIKESDVETIPADNLDDACEKLKRHEADAMVAGIDCPTRDVILTCKKHLEMTSHTFSSCFLLKKPGAKTYILADAGVTKNPTKDQLIEIIKQTYASAQKLLEETPKIAVLSFSTKGSAKDDSIDKINQAIAEIPKEIIIDGELQLDAAINPEIAAKKCPSSPVKGEANVLITPDLNSGNILYKAFEQIGDYTAAGPILQGFNFPISDLSRGSTVKDVALVIDCIKKLI